MGKRWISMVLAINEVNGFEKGKRYTKNLEFSSCFKNGKLRVVALIDADDNTFYWTTTEDSADYRNFRLKATYSFVVSYISTVFDPANPKVNIAELEEVVAAKMDLRHAKRYKLEA
ncbi:hypothetical protein [Planomicrobium sp. CPCC 101079]|uniref:hypothetical protein n=1 Tax=Planomicrobium sp. CPCC 101079 TaxID=2599618 RepID=UPI00164449BE|nr:hypothetical protein [Planomicrobium sp. CPCC 101079]